ncbi:MAG: hypothetical protein JO328_09540 [Hyphomicrobiales bacterium]|nr:hypothetical protein [Hyphomicrobiales bacterium]MBV8824401.1 hypothetical protein [Hyphomicrobiales bacterium]
MAGGETVAWDEWQPRLFDSDLRPLISVYSTLPGLPLDCFPNIIWRYEDPDSRDAFPGSISLERHDCLHIILGRGLLNQDEAFVIGFTMGAARNATFAHCLEFQHVASTLYTPPFQWSDSDLSAFRLAFHYAQTSSSVVRDLHLIPFELRMTESIHALRRLGGISVPDLKMLFECEKLLVTQSKASLRLPREIETSDFRR